MLLWILQQFRVSQEGECGLSSLRLRWSNEQCRGNIGIRGGLHFINYEAICTLTGLLYEMLAQNPFFGLAPLAPLKKRPELS